MMVMECASLLLRKIRPAVLLTFIAAGACGRSPLISDLPEEVAGSGGETGDGARKDAGTGAGGNGGVGGAPETGGRGGGAYGTSGGGTYGIAGMPGIGGAGTGGRPVSGGTEAGGGSASAGITGAGGRRTGGAVGAGGIASGGAVSTGGRASGGAVSTGGRASGGAVGTGGIASGGSGGAGGACSPGMPCGGDLVGTWAVTSSCLKVAGPLDLNVLGLNCQGAGIAGDLQVTGSWTAGPDGRYVDDTTTFGSEQIVLPASCLQVSGATISCPMVATVLGAIGYTGVSCTSAAGGGCTCSATVKQAGGMGVLGLGSRTAGTYKTAGNLVTLDQQSTYGYCVSGATMTLTPRGTNPSTTGAVVFEKR